MAVPGAWLIAPEGRGTLVDAQAIEALALDTAPKWTRVRPHKREIVALLRTLAAWDGPRLLWFVGDACHDDIGWCLRTDDASDGLRLEDIGKLLLEAAEGQPHPLIAILDVCHAGHARPRQPPKHENLALFLACDAEELTRADDNGGWLTRTLIEALTTLPGAIDLHTLDGFIIRRREADGLGAQWPHAVLGQLGTYPLHHREATVSQDLLAGPLRRKRISGEAPTHLVRVISGRTLFNLAAASDGFQQEFSDDLNPEEVALVAEFAQNVQDWADIANDIELGGQVEAAQSLGEDLKNLAERGFLVLAAREKQVLVGGGGQSPFWILHLAILRETDPNIVRTPNP